jgi:pyruvate,orthophosphate dikinase
MRGKVSTVQPELSDDFETIMNWADDKRRMTIRANAETPTDAQIARKFGAQGIGLCRTEHMFFDTDRILRMREMILSETEEDRRAALAHLEPMQRQDFIELFKIMAGLPVTIRLLDPPLHEFLPHGETEIAALAKDLGLDKDKLSANVARLSENNPMLGHRGCR